MVLRVIFSRALELLKGFSVNYFGVAYKMFRGRLVRTHKPAPKHLIDKRLLGGLLSSVFANPPKYPPTHSEWQCR